MKLARIDFPQPLLAALRDRKLVVFAGAGVSMGEPACLPDFPSLATMIAQGTGETCGKGEPVDRFLGRLQHKGVNVHALAAEQLGENRCGVAPQPTSLHHDLLRLYSKADPVLVVTTNFDLLFERAAQSIFDADLERFRAPALPLGRDFNGIVHLHGSLDRPEDMVLTDADFGRAYLTESWARRFLVGLFRSFTVLFVGYSHNDRIMNYLARALPVGAGGHRFALTNDGDGRSWKMRGITRISYPDHPDGEHHALYEGVRRLGTHVTRGTQEWQRLIAEIAYKLPSLDEEETDLLDEAFADKTRIRFFTDVATSPEWIAWLDGRKQLDGLFGTAELIEQEEELARWLAHTFARSHADSLFLLISRHDTRLHPSFWFDLGRVIGVDSVPPLDANTLARWVSVLLATAPTKPDEFILSLLAERCTECGLWDRLVEVFAALSANHLSLKPWLPWPDEESDGDHPAVKVESEPADRHATIDSVWETCLKPHLDCVAAPLLAAVVDHLAAQHRTLREWEAASYELNSASFSRHAIEPHEQDEYPEPIDVAVSRKWWKFEDGVISG